MSRVNKCAYRVMVFTDSEIFVRNLFDGDECAHPVEACNKAVAYHVATFRSAGYASMEIPKVTRVRVCNLDNLKVNEYALGDDSDTLVPVPVSV